MRARTAGRISIIGIMILFLFACAPFTSGTKTISFSDMSPQQKVTWAMGVYNAAYADYQVQSEWPDLTEVEKQTLREKKKMLIDLHSAIELYDAVAARNDVSDSELESGIMSIISQLERKVVRNIE